VMFTKYSGTGPSLPYHDPPASPDLPAVVEAEAEAEEVESAEAIRIRAPVLSATGVGSVTIRMAPDNDNSYFPNVQDRPEVVAAAVAVAEEVIREDAAAVGMVVAVAVAVVVVAVGVYANSTILPKAANLAQIAPSAMTEFSCTSIFSIDED